MLNKPIHGLFDLGLPRDSQFFVDIFIHRNILNFLGQAVKGRIVIMITVAVALPRDSASAASAVAFDKKSGTWGASWGNTTVADAEGKAIQRCLTVGGKECVVILQCENSGFGAAYSRNVHGRRQFGFSCGAETDLEAQKGARYRCEVQVAIALGALPESAADAKLDWSFVLQRLRNACPGLGNCRCGNREALWKG